MAKILANDKLHYLPSIYISAIETSSTLTNQEKKLLKTLITNYRQDKAIRTLAHEGKVKEDDVWKKILPHLEEINLLTKDTRLITLNVEGLDLLVAKQQEENKIK